LMLMLKFLICQTVCKHRYVVAHIISVFLDI
jgi:hypothetical protein